MSTLTLPTRDWVGLLEDTVLTAGSDPDTPHLAAVLLHCDTADVVVLGSPGEIEHGPVLVATSTDDQSMAAQAHTACVGQLHKPVLVATEDVKALIKVFKPLIGSGKTTTRQVQLEVTGEFLTVSEAPDQVPDGISVTVPTLDLADYPRTVPTLLQPDPKGLVLVDGQAVAPSYGTGNGFGHLEIFAKIGKRRKMQVRFYRHHQRRPVVVEIGSMYHAAFLPGALDDEEQYAEPQVPVFTPRLPAPVVKGEAARPLASVR